MSDLVLGFVVLSIIALKRAVGTRITVHDRSAGARWSYGQRGLVWTPQNQILYTSAASALSGSELWEMNADGSNPHRLLGGKAIWPAVSRDSGTLIFASDRSGEWSLWSSRLDGTGARQLAGVRGGAYANVSSDGQSVYYLGTDGKIKKIAIGGGLPIDVTQDESDGGRVSPNGKLLACGLPRAHTTAVIDLATGQTLKSFKPSRAFQWTRDGKSFVYVEDANLWRQPIAGGAPERLTDFDSGLINLFDWSPDQTRLVISRRLITSDAVLIRNFR